MSDTTDNKKIPRILLLDDEGEIVELCAEVLRGKYQVIKTSSPFEAISLMDAGRDMIDLVISDYEMPGMNGIEFVDKLRSLGIRTPAILYSGKTISQQSQEFMKVLEKPFRPKRLLEEVEKALYSIRQDEIIHKQFKGILAHLDVSLDNLARVLVNNGHTDYLKYNPETALQVMGQGDVYHIYMTWHYLNELRDKIHG